MRPGDGVDEELVSPDPLVSHFFGPLVQHPLASARGLAVEKVDVAIGVAVHLVEVYRLGEVSSSSMLLFLLLIWYMC